MDGMAVGFSWVRRKAMGWYSRPCTIVAAFESWRDGMDGYAISRGATCDGGS